jgi:hypothetical protein
MWDILMTQALAGRLLLRIVGEAKAWDITFVVHGMYRFSTHCRAPILSHRC